MLVNYGLAISLERRETIINNDKLSWKLIEILQKHDLFTAQIIYPTTVGAIQCRKVSTHAGYIKRESSGLSWPGTPRSPWLRRAHNTCKISSLASVSCVQHFQWSTVLHTLAHRDTQYLAILQLVTKPQSECIRHFCHFLNDVILTLDQLRALVLV